MWFEANEPAEPPTFFCKMWASLTTWIQHSGTDVSFVSEPRNKRFRTEKEAAGERPGWSHFVNSRVKTCQNDEFCIRLRWFLSMGSLQSFTCNSLLCMFLPSGTDEHCRGKVSHAFLKGRQLSWMCRNDKQDFWPTTCWKIAFERQQIAETLRKVPADLFSV